MVALANLRDKRTLFVAFIDSVQIFDHFGECYD